MSSVVLLSGMQGLLNVTSDVARAAGWYGYNSNLSTVAITIQNFRGRIYMQAALALNPVESDWFPIQLVPMQDYIQYPVMINQPTGLNGGDSGTSGYTFKANILYIRVKVYRSYLFNSTPTQEEINALGNARILLSL